MIKKTGVKRSYWCVSYGGPHFGVFMKKLKRAMDVEPMDIVTSVHNSKDGKCIYTGFFLEHSADCWAELIVLTMGTAQIISPEWKVIMAIEPGIKDELTGNNSRTLSGYFESAHRTLSDMRTMYWQICESQNYKLLT